MSSVLIDTSVLLKWFHTEGETEVAEAHALRDAHARGEIDAYVLDLCFSEIGNVLSRALRWAPEDVAQQLDDLRAIFGHGVTLSEGGFRMAAHLAAEHGLSFYDAAWAATSEELGVTLVSADRMLLRSGLAASATVAAGRLGLLE